MGKRDYYKFTYKKLKLDSCYLRRGWKSIWYLEELFKAAETTADQTFFSSPGSHDKNRIVIGERGEECYFMLCFNIKDYRAIRFIRDWINWFALISLSMSKKQYYSIPFHSIISCHRQGAELEDLQSLFQPYDSMSFYLKGFGMGNAV